MPRRNIIQSSGLTPTLLTQIYQIDLRTDSEIGDLYGISDVAVSYFRRKWGVPTITPRQRREAQRGGPTIDDVTPVQLSTLYTTMGDRGIAKLYGVSKFTVASKRKSYGIESLSKTDRSTHTDTFTDEQKEVVIGTMLGDGHLLERGVLKVSHYQEQIGYLTALHGMLAPHSLPVFYEEKEMENGRLTFTFGFRTVQHQWLKHMRDVFYPAGVKVFPDAILKSLTPSSLAYWYFDDGYLDGGLPAFALGDVSDEAHKVVVRLVGERFGLDTYMRPVSNETCRCLGVRGRSTYDFFTLVSEFAPADMLYKIPPRYWPKGAVPRSPTRTPDETLLPRGFVSEGKFWAKNWLSLSVDEKANAVESFAQFWETRGFPHHVPRPEALPVLASLDDSHIIQGDVIRARQVGQEICQGIATHIWGAKSYGAKSPLELFSDPTKLRQVIDFCFRMGDVPNASRLRSSLRLWRRGGVYNFRPSAAKALVDRYCPQNGVVFDPCGGYGGRLLGSVLSKANARYVACEPAVDTYTALLRLTDWVASYVPSVQSRVTLHNLPAEEMVFPSSVDVVMTSPPYWKREVYDDAETQSALRYPTYESWLHNFWETVLQRSVRCLRVGGVLILNVDDFSLEGKHYPLIEDTVRLIKPLGLGNPERLQYEMPNPSGQQGETVLCWFKQEVVARDVVPLNPLVLPTCRLCGKVKSKAEMTAAKECSECQNIVQISCAGCGVVFQPTRAGNTFHNAACYAKYRRALVRKLNPVSDQRTFTCKKCSVKWQTSEKGNFSFCSPCREVSDIAARKKTCQYRHCGDVFLDTSRKNTMKFCQEEHRRREKLFRAGVATDESYFRSNHPVGIRTCQTCKASFERLTGKSVRCACCREKTRHKACRKCGASYRDDTLNNTRRFCASCSPQGD